MKDNNKKIIIGVIVAVLVVAIGLFFFFRKGNDVEIKPFTKKIDIDKVLKSEAYDYLPVQAKSYVKEVYEETGKVILTEKNKKDNVAYLSPAYIQYLIDKDTKIITNEPFEKTDENKNKVYYGVIPSTMTMDYDYSKVGNTITTNFPEKYDLRDVDGKNYVSEVEDGTLWGLCWAFAYNGALESKVMKTYNLDEVDFSIRQIDYARSDPSAAIDIGVNPYNSTVYSSMLYNVLTSGGDINVFSKNILFGVSPISEKKWNYEYDDLSILPPKEVWNFDNVEYDVDEFNIYYKNTKNSKDDLIKLIKQKIIDNGSLGVAINYDMMLEYPVLGSGQKALKFGMLNHLLLYQDENLPKKYDYEEIYNHAIQIIGWDDNYEYTICYNDKELKNPTLGKCSDGYTKKDIKGAWILQNSYGSMHEPYLYLAYESTANEFVSFNKVNKKTWDNEYNYNFSSDTNRISLDKIVFNYESLNKEKLEKIRFYANLSLGDTLNKKFDIYLSTTGKDSDYKLITSKTVQYNGLYTIDMSSKNIVLNGKFKLKFVLDKYTFYSDEITLFTSNVNNNIKIQIDDAKSTDNNYIRSLVKEDNAILLNGFSRNLKTSDAINYKIYKDNVDVTSKFKFDRNYSVSNIINTIISYNSSDVKIGEYKAEAYVNNVKYDEFKITIKNTVKKMSGHGTSKKPFIITDKYQLDSIRYSTNYAYKLGNDIIFDDSDYKEGGAFYNDGKGFEPIGPKTTFSGNIEKKLTNKAVNDFGENINVMLDGNNKRIVNLKINRPKEDYVGLFRGIYNENNEASVKDIIFENAYIKGRNLVGVLSGVATAADPLLSYELVNIKIDNSVVKGNSYVGQLSGALEIQSSADLGNIIDNAFVAVMGDFIKVNDISILDSNGRSKVEANNYAGGIFGIVKSIKYSDTYKEMNLNKLINYADVEASNGYAGGITSKVIMHSKDISLTFDDVSNYGIINGKTCKAQIFCEANVIGDDSVYGTVNFKNVYYQRDYAFIDGRADVKSSNSIIHSFAHSIKNKKEFSCEFGSGVYSFSKKDKGYFTLECESKYGFGENVSLTKSDFTFTYGILTKLFKATVENVNKTGMSSDGKKVTFNVTVAPGLFKGKTTLILRKNSIKDLNGNSNKKVSSSTINITK